MMMTQTRQLTRFAPMLFMQDVKAAMSFYEKAFGAVEIRRFSNEDGSVHVAEMEIDGNIFHLHEETQRNNELGPFSLKGTTTVIGLYTEYVDEWVANAKQAGATITEPVKDYEYGLRQAYLTDPFGHHW